MAGTDNYEQQRLVERVDGAVIEVWVALEDLKALKYFEQQPKG